VCTVSYFIVVMSKKRESSSPSHRHTNFLVVKERIIITMKCSVCVCGLALSLSPPVVGAFLGPAPWHRVGVAVRSEAEDHLEALAEKWSELKTKEQELLGKHDLVRYVRYIGRPFRGTISVFFLAAVLFLTIMLLLLLLSICGLRRWRQWTLPLKC
jgi:hypothetical protein